MRLELPEIAELGYQQLPLTLAAQFQSLGGVVQTNHAALRPAAGVTNREQ